MINIILSGAAVPIATSLTLRSTNPPSDTISPFSTANIWNMELIVLRELGIT
jgi:hypothetical protein